jgi:hypothetical protein
LQSSTTLRTSPSASKRSQNPAAPLPNDHISPQPTPTTPASNANHAVGHPDQEVLLEPDQDISTLLQAIIAKGISVVNLQKYLETPLEQVEHDEVLDAELDEGDPVGALQPVDHTAPESEDEDDAEDRDDEEALGAQVSSTQL